MAGGGLLGGGGLVGGLALGVRPTDVVSHRVSAAAVKREEILGGLRTLSPPHVVIGTDFAADD